jgi:hypothetical protein
MRDVRTGFDQGQDVVFADPIETAVAPAGEAALRDTLEVLGEEVGESLAALYGAPEGVAELVFSSMPRALKSLCLTYGIARFEGEDAEVTEFGRAVIEAAAARWPIPYSDVSIDDLSPEALEAIKGLPEPSLSVRFPRKYRGRGSSGQGGAGARGGAHAVPVLPASAPTAEGTAAGAGAAGYV